MMRKSDQIECEVLAFCAVEGNGFTALVEATVADTSRSWEMKHLTAPYFTHRYLFGCFSTREITIIGIRRSSDAFKRRKHCRRVTLPPAPDIGDTCQIVPNGQLYEFGWRGQAYGWAAVD